MSISYRKLDIALSADKETVLVFGQELLVPESREDLTRVTRGLDQR